MEIKIFTIYYQDYHSVVSEKEALEYPAEMVGRFTFQCKPYDGNAAIEVGKKMNAANLLNAQGIGDTDALAAAKGKFIGQSVIESGSRKVGSGEEVAVNAESVGTLPLEVLAEFGSRVNRGPRVTKDELEALKKKPEASTVST